MVIGDQAECDLEGATDGESNENATRPNMVTIQAHHITKVAAEMLMDFA